MPLKTLAPRAGEARRFRALRSKIASALVALMTALPAAAGIGQPAGTVAFDAAAMRGAVVSASSKGSFRVHAIAAPGGIDVREYVASPGTVFAISWSASAMPDLKLLLASYYPRYALEVQTSERGTKHLAIDSPDFVLRIVKLPRGFAGAAYLPQLMPKGVSPADLM